MRTIRVAKIAILLAGILILGFGLPMSAQTFSVTLTKANPSVNVGVCSGAGDWVFTYTVTGKANLLGLAIKNNPSAGDFCWGTQVRKPKGSDQEVMALSIPTAALNACGVQFQDSNGVPLNFNAYLEGVAPGGSVGITVDYPSRSVDDPPCP